MRTLFFLGVMAGFATLGYIFAPRLVEDNYRPNDEAQTPVVSEGQGVAMATPAVPEGPKPQPQAKVKTEKKPTKVKAKKSKHSASSEGSDEALDRVESKEVERVTGLRPLNGEVKNAPEEIRKPALAAKHEPLKSRWIDDLSGAKVRFSKKSMNDACAQEYSNCERPEAPKDISVAGVVVKTERLVKQPKDPLDGSVQQGNYIDHTPAVYVE